MYIYIYIYYNYIYIYVIIYIYIIHIICTNHFFKVHPPGAGPG